MKYSSAHRTGRLCSNFFCSSYWETGSAFYFDHIQTFYRSEESFEHHFSTMPWLAFPFDHEKLNLLTRMYGVNGIKTVSLLIVYTCVYRSFLMLVN